MFVFCLYVCMFVCMCVCLYVCVSDIKPDTGEKSFTLLVAHVSTCTHETFILPKLVLPRRPQQPQPQPSAPDSDPPKQRQRSDDQASQQPARHIHSTTPIHVPHTKHGTQHLACAWLKLCLTRHATARAQPESNTSNERVTFVHTPDDYEPWHGR